MMNAHLVRIGDEVRAGGAVISVIARALGHRREVVQFGFDIGQAIRVGHRWFSWEKPARFKAAERGTIRAAVRHKAILAGPRWRAPSSTTGGRAAVASAAALRV